MGSDTEQIYTIPVNEAFALVGEHAEEGCPFCVLFKKLEEDELEITLGASMMEPDIRIRTNDLGFCARHYARMLKRKRMLGMGLIMESHLAEVKGKLTAKNLIGDISKESRDALRKLNRDCYVCGRIEHNLTAMIRTAVLLWETDGAFPNKFAKVPYFCLPHYTAMMDYAALKMSKKLYRSFFEQARAIEERTLDALAADVSWFCKKFDYRYDEEPWYNSKDAVQRAVKFLSGDREE